MKDIVRVDKAPAPMLLLLVAIAAAQDENPPAPVDTPPPAETTPAAAEEETRTEEETPPAPVDTPVQAGKGPQLTGYMQIWATAWDMDEDPEADPATYGDPEDDVGFKLRRVRIGLVGRRSIVDYVVTIGTETEYDALTPPSESVGVEDAVVAVHPFEGAAVTLGLQKVPVGREELFSTRELVLAERAVLSAWLVPGHDVGLSGDWTKGLARFRAGVFNGNGSILGDDNLGMLWAGRVELAQGGPTKWKDVYETWGKVKETTVGVAIDAYDNMDVATNELGGGIDAMLRLGGVAVMLEGRGERLEPSDTSVDVPEVPSTTTRVGALAMVAATFGQWEPAIRASWFDDSVALEDNGDTGEITGGVTLHSRADQVRVGAGYVARLELAGTPLKNDTARLWLQLAL
jgi:hypothetical protein